MRNILLAIGVLTAFDKGASPSPRDIADLRALAANPREIAMPLADLACVVITREHRRRRKESTARYKAILSYCLRCRRNATDRIKGCNTTRVGGS